MLNHGIAKTFMDYAEQVFLPYVSSKLENTTRLDIVWYVYQTEEQMCAETSSYLCSDSKDIEGFRARWREQGRTVQLHVTPGHHFTKSSI